MRTGQDNPTLGRHKRAVGVFPNRHDAERALHELQDSNFPMDRVSIIARDEAQGDDIAGAEVRDRVGNKADDGAKTGAISGGALGGITGLLVGLGALAIPGIGPILLAGAGATTIATTLAGAGIGAAAGGLVGALIGAGIPEDRARAYNDRVARGGYLLIVEGTDRDISRAEVILHNRGIEDYGVYDAPDLDRDRPDHIHSNPSGSVQTYPTAMGTVSPVATDRISRQRRAIGVFTQQSSAEAAITDLKNSGFSMNQVSVIAKDTGNHDRITDIDVNVRQNNEVRKGNQADDGAKAGAVTGGILGGLGGLLVGLGVLAIPGIGPVLAGGAAATALTTAISGGAIGATAGGLAGGLVGLGIPEDRAKVYNERFEQGDYLVMVDGTEDEIHRAEAIMNQHGIRDWGVFNTTDSYAASGGITGSRTSDMNLTDRPTHITGDPNVARTDRRNETF